MTGQDELGLATASKLFEKYGVLITQDPDTKIYVAIWGGETIKDTSVTAIVETILEKWSDTKSGEKRRAPLFGCDRGRMTITDDFDAPLEEFENY
ncbi:hypothetical protein QT972_09815 [Microcoleus sp. herbarium7]|uniref:hypothetical protein n=1 Tax=Microcoleus sp. herbarium7 TaxID=3055435 RepID=UPI002FD3D0D9